MTTPTDPNLITPIVPSTETQIHTTPTADLTPYPPGTTVIPADPSLRLPTLSSSKPVADPNNPGVMLQPTVVMVPTVLNASYPEIAADLFALYGKEAALIAKIRANTDPSKYAALLEEQITLGKLIAARGAQIASMIRDGRVKEVDIATAHARNGQVPVDGPDDVLDEDGNPIVDPAPPVPIVPSPVPTPIVPAPVPSPSGSYDVWSTSYPTTALGFKVGDHIYQRPSDLSLGYNVSPASFGISENSNFKWIGDVVQ